MTGKPDLLHDEIVIGGDSVDIPNGTYPAILDTIRTMESAAFGEFRAWDFILDSGQAVGGATSMATGAKSKGGRWIAALLGRKPEKGEKVQLSGKPCQVMVQEDDKGWPKVIEVFPPKQGEPEKATSEHVTVGASQEDLPF